MAGLINDYMPARGDFDSWAADPEHGGRLDVAHLDLTQKRNHILTAALEALPDASRRLLSTLSLLPESFDYAILAALNPHRPPEPEAVTEPERPEDEYGPMWEQLRQEDQEQLRRDYAPRWSNGGSTSGRMRPGRPHRKLSRQPACSPRPCAISSSVGCCNTNARPAAGTCTPSSVLSPPAGWATATAISSDSRSSTIFPAAPRPR